MDARVKPAHDESRILRLGISSLGQTQSASWWGVRRRLGEGGRLEPCGRPILRDAACGRSSGWGRIKQV